MSNEKMNNQVESNVEEVNVESNPLILEESTQAETQTDDVNNVMGNLFVDDNTTDYSGGQQLSSTARLTNIASQIASSVFEEANANPQDYALNVQASIKSHDAMDDLINELHNLGNVDVDFLKSLDEEEIDKMIRSQQSKRSRAKSKAMTRENYMTMMVGAVAENLLRIAGDKPKSSGGSYSTSVGYTDEDLEAFANYPEDLKKAIRNVQSKKSIMKSKADFDPTSVRWQELLQTEEQLKAIRDNQTSQASKEAQEALDRQAKLNEMLQSANIEDADPDQAAEMLKAVQDMLAGK